MYSRKHLTIEFIFKSFRFIFSTGRNFRLLTFTPDGSKLLVANEGEFASVPGNIDDPEGSISIIDIATIMNPNPTVNTATFTSFNAQKLALQLAGVRFFNAPTVAQDVEPEYITVSADSTTAWISLQENNALAVLDIDNAIITDILPLGFKNHNLPGNGLDASDRDNAINIQNWPVFGLYMPDAIASFVVTNEVSNNTVIYSVTVPEPVASWSLLGGGILVILTHKRKLK